MVFKKEWSAEDQDYFARLSGDFNPIHVDDEVSRRSIFGKTVVHGVHVLVWALNEYVRTKHVQGALKGLKVFFRKHIVVGEPCELSFDDDGPDLLRVKVTSRGEVCFKIAAEFVKDDGGVRDHYVQKTFVRQQPKDRAVESIAGLRGRLQIAGDIHQLGARYPELCRALPEHQLAFLVTTTRLVGMECPGLFSIYSELEINFVQKGDCGADLEYEVLEHNPVFNFIKVHLSSSIATGEITAFIRPALRKRDLIAQLRSVVARGEFYGQRALIIGGSRGLGEVAAKALALGGADIVASFCHGKKDAVLIGEDLVKWTNSFRAVQIDVRWPSQDILKALPQGWHPTHLYYFATPFISDGIKMRFSGKIFDSFSDIYIHGFWRVFEIAYSFKSLRFVLYPSTSFLDEFPANMFEYSVAKAAGEGMCAYIKKYFPDVDVLCPRFERLATDQTVSLFPVDTQDPVGAILSILRRSRQGH